MKYILILAFCLCGALATTMTKDDEKEVEVTSSDELKKDVDVTSLDEMKVNIEMEDRSNDDMELEIDMEDSRNDDDDDDVLHRKNLRKCAVDWMKCRTMKCFIDAKKFCTWVHKRH